MQLGDIDRDGDVDVICGNKQGLLWYENPLIPSGDPRKGGWKAHKIGSDGANVHDLELGDLNGDKKVDVVIRYEKENDRSVRVYLQETATSFIEITSVNSSNKKAEGLGLGDIDHDGDIDLALGNIWCENNGSGTKWTEHSYAAGLPDQLMIRVGDVNEDRKNEIVICPQSSKSGPLAWFSSSNPEGSWTKHIIVSSVNRMHGLALADFNKDGRLDIHTSLRHDRSGSNDRISIWINSGASNPRFTEQVLANSGSHFSKVGDIGGDGDIDIIGANWSSSAPNGAPIELWENLSEGASSHPPAVGAADMTFDFNRREDN